MLVLNILSIPVAGATLAAGTNSAQGTLDLANNAMILNYTTSGAAAIASANALVGSASDQEA